MEKCEACGKKAHLARRADGQMTCLDYFEALAEKMRYAQGASTRPLEVVDTAALIEKARPKASVFGGEE